jgi:hypothetical protein
MLKRLVMELEADLKRRTEQWRLWRPVLSTVLG